MTTTPVISNLLQLYMKKSAECKINLIISIQINVDVSDSPIRFRIWRDADIYPDKPIFLVPSALRKVLTVQRHNTVFE